MYFCRFKKKKLIIRFSTMKRFNTTRNAFFLSLCILGYTISAQAQQNAPNGQAQRLIIDPKIRYGQLDNGMTYYLRHNEMPKERAEFYIVHNVGSMQEDDDQRGLAHFLEHMAFNGSVNFPSKKGIQDYTESLGMRFGENLNAGTGFDETVYMLMNVPVTRENIIDSCLLILHDWSSFLLLEDEAIEKERDVIREEWRTRRTAQMRLWEQQLPQMYPQSKYGKRLPIGILGIIENFQRNALVNYYNKWYRPDLQALIIIGDIDVDQVEEKIKKTFSDIPKALNPEPKELYLVPNNSVPLVSVAKDKEMTNTILYIYYKHEKIPFNLKGTIADLFTNYTQQLIDNIMSERFSEILQKPDPPFIAAYASDGDFFVSKTKGAWTSIAVAKPNELQRAMNALILENEKVKKFGFTEAEFERAKDNVLKMYENAYLERENQQNETFAQEYIGHFTNGDYIPGIEIEYEIIKDIAQIIPVEAINTQIRNIFSESENYKNMVISLVGPDIEGMVYPSEKELLSMLLVAENQIIEENEEETISKILVPVLPKKGSIVSVNKDNLFDNYVLKLSNGAQVIIKQTDFKKDEILMTACRSGGQTTFKDEKDIWNLKLLNDVIPLGGLGDFSVTNLNKALAGKNIKFNMGLTPSSEVITGSASPSDLKSLFEIIYLIFTEIRTDHDAYDAFRERVIAQLNNLNLNPDYTFTDSLKSILYNNNVRNMNLKTTEFEKMDYYRMMEMSKERFADAANFTFTFVGNIAIDTIKPLIEQYLASLPALNRKNEPDENQMTPFQSGVIKKHYTKQLETPKATIHLMYTGKMPYTLKNLILAQVLNGIFDLVFDETIRENEGASYYVANQIDLYDFPLGRTSHQINFDTNPERYNEMIDIVKTEVNRIAAEGPSNENIVKSISSIIRKNFELQQQNDYWLGIISAYYDRGYDSHTDYIQILSDLTKEDIQNFAKQLLEQGNLIELVMYPE